ncbi:hypothetical protein UFOVP736_12 [uncultured Caudovirales phage]|uniref:Major capsid protein n=1 Tax=uncultured Caudovirales phage TaxID=2100421 RepID=A0A6J5NQ77_9CAUD|nr:hypothetical protein UFOVP705_69 [uncultured Caudovirales phage]CAB5223820.1 hypothetical protein UFOVP736_12 [uncultured Caudovirales phage]
MKGTAIRRGELNAFIEQASGVDKLFIGQQVLPVLGVKKRSAEYPVLRKAKGGLLMRDNTKRNSAGTYNEISRKHEWDNYTCEDRGLEERVDDTKADEMSDFFDLEVKTTKLVGRACKMDFENQVKARIFDESVFAKEDADVNYLAANAATVDPAADFLNAIAQLTARGQMPNTMVMNLAMWNYIRRSKLLQAYIYGSNNDNVKVIKKADVERIFGEESGGSMTLMIAAAVQSTSNKGKETIVTSPIWPTSHIWIGNVQSGDFANGGAGRTLSWEADAPNGLFLTETYRDDTRRADMVRVRSNSIEKIIDEDAGQLIKTNADF